KLRIVDIGGHVLVHFIQPALNGVAESFWKCSTGGCHYRYVVGSAHGSARESDAFKGGWRIAGAEKNREPDKQKRGRQAPRSLRLQKKTAEINHRNRQAECSRLPHRDPSAS